MAGSSPTSTILSTPPFCFEALATKFGCSLMVLGIAGISRLRVPSKLHQTVSSRCPRMQAWAAWSGLPGFWPHALTGEARCGGQALKSSRDDMCNPTSHTNRGRQLPLKYFFEWLVAAQLATCATHNERQKKFVASAAFRYRRLASVSKSRPEGRQRLRAL